MVRCVLIMLFVGMSSFPVWAAEVVYEAQQVGDPVIEPAQPTSETSKPIPKRVVSLNLCTDQLALAYAEEGQLVGVSYNAANPAFSAQASEAKAYPLLKGNAEELLKIKPDLVLMGEGQDSVLQAWLAEQEIEVMTLGVPVSVTELQAQMQQVANRLGAGAVAVAEVVVQNNALQPVGSFWEGSKVALYYPSGFSDGRHTLMDDVITRMKGVNIAAVAGEGQQHLSMETLLASKPDIIVTQQETALGQASMGELLAKHPALKETGALRVAVPAQWLACPHRHIAQIAGAMQGVVIE